MASEQTSELIVAVERDSTDGKLYSCVRENPHRNGHFFVVDRQKGRMLDAEVVKSRARGLAVLLGFRYVEDLRWRCVAERLRTCGCPICCGAVLNGPPAPEPEPAYLDPQTRQPIARATEGATPNG